MKYFSIFFMVVFLLTKPVFAAEIVNTDNQGVALKGYDPVAYFIENRAVAGNPQFSHEFEGATWYFANVENMQLFSVRPPAFMPQYGGFCAYAAAKGQQADIDPSAWTLYQDKLYLNHNPGVMNLWRRDKDSNIQKADAYWKRLLSEG